MNRVRIFLGVAIAVLVLVSLLPASASAAGQQYPYYIAFKPGAFFPQGDIDDLDTGFQGELAFGRQFNENFAFEMSVGWMNLDKTERGSLEINGTTYSGRASVDLDIIPVVINFKPMLPIGNCIELYGIAGFGAYFVNGEVSVRENVGNVSYRSKDDDSDTVFGFTAGLGIHFNISPRVFIGAEGKYLFTTEAKLWGVKTNLDGIYTSGVIGIRF
jgi:opacity protein-like surface antigen